MLEQRCSRVLAYSMGCILGQSPSCALLMFPLNATSMVTTGRSLGALIGEGLRPSRKAENPNQAMGWKSTGLRKHTQASRTSVLPLPAPNKPTSKKQPPKKPF